MGYNALEEGELQDSGKDTRATSERRINKAPAAEPKSPGADSDFNMEEWFRDGDDESKTNEEVYKKQMEEYDRMYKEMEMQEEFELGRKRSLSPRDRNQRGRSPFSRGRSGYRGDSFRYDYNEHDRKERDNRRRRYSGGRDDRDTHSSYQNDSYRNRDSRGDAKQAMGQSFDKSPSRSASR